MAVLWCIVGAQHGKHGSCTSVSMSFHYTCRKCSARLGLGVGLASRPSAPSLRTFLPPGTLYPSPLPPLPAGADRAGAFCDWIFVSPTPSMIIFEDLTRDVRWVAWRNARRAAL